MRGMWVIFCNLCFFNAFAALPDVVLCDNGYPIVAADTGEYSCRSYSQDNCENGYLKQVIHGFSWDSVGGSCADGAVTGKGVYVLNSLPTVLCEDGYYNGNECVRYVENSELCPKSYRNIFDINSFRLVADSAECPSDTWGMSAWDGTHSSDEEQMFIHSYPYTKTTDNMIALRMCEVGYEMNHLGNCVKLCAVSGVNYLRTSTGVIVPVYASKITTPSLNIKAGNAKQCYVNLLPEFGTGAINIKYNEELYHAVN